MFFQEKKSNNFITYIEVLLPLGLLFPGLGFFFKNMTIPIYHNYMVFSPFNYGGLCNSSFRS
jgi:hypothetical protein